MSRHYRFHVSDELYFVTCTAVNWIDVFTRDHYREIIIDSLRYCQQQKGLLLYAWVIMTNHLHLIISTDSTAGLSGIMRDFKSFTSRHIRKAIENSGEESRKQWLMMLLSYEGKWNASNKDWQLWVQDNHPVALDSAVKVQQRLQYLHQNPVRAGYVDEASHWKWSSAGDYEGKKGLLDIILLE